MVQDIHLQVNLSQTPEVGRLQHSANQQIVALQETIANKTETQTKNEETEVQTTQRADKRGLGRKSLFWWKKKKKELTDEKAEISEVPDPVRGKVIDVVR